MEYRQGEGILMPQPHVAYWWNQTLALMSTTPRLRITIFRKRKFCHFAHLHSSWLGYYWLFCKPKFLRSRTQALCRRIFEHHQLICLVYGKERSDSCGVAEGLEMSELGYKNLVSCLQGKTLASSISLTTALHLFFPSKIPPKAFSCTHHGR